jgi:hypothetical protein
VIALLLDAHERRGAVAAAQTAGGKAAVWAAGTALLVWHDVNALMIAAFALVLVFPERRRWLLMLAAFGLIAGKFLPNAAFDLSAWPEALAGIDGRRWAHGFASIVVATVAILSLVAAALRFEKLPPFVRRHPLLVLHALLLGALALGAVTRLQALLLAPYLMWRASYLLKTAASGRAVGTSLQDHLFYLVPVFGGTNTPYGKGFEYLDRSEARSAEAFARSQLAGLKLLVLAIVLTFLLALMDAVVHGRADTAFGTSLASWSLALPTVADLLAAPAAQPLWARWSSLYLDLVHVTLRMAIWGHVIVGCLRLLGFNVFRNTYRPLLARSIVEFWNRFYYYFKELLVDLFFYPAFYRSRWASPRLRILIAILAAAFAGNVYFHLVREHELLFGGDGEALVSFLVPRMIYCGLLALGIWLSMLRQQERRRKGAAPTGIVALRAIAGVWTFYGLIHLWIASPFEFGVAQRWDFLLSLAAL